MRTWSWPRDGGVWGVGVLVDPAGEASTELGNVGLMADG